VSIGIPFQSKDALCIPSRVVAFDEIHATKADTQFDGDLDREQIAYVFN
jgi:hypothetical protein